ncbi:hypothetical protein A2U01_0100154, partial [Trifolium medium]|nr:hypothetical protein [Trifolium medium]
MQSLSRYPSPQCLKLTTTARLRLISPKEPSISDISDQWR